jgi:hypothetical protein
LNIALTERIGSGRQDLEYSGYFFAIQHRKHQYGTNFQAAIGCGIDPKVDLGIVATLDLSALNASS